MIQFGTDGWRGVIAEDFTFENVRKVAQAIADYLKKSEAIPRLRSGQGSQKPEVIVGYDRRFLSEEYAKTVCEVLAANNIVVFFTGKPTPTPAITLAIKKQVFLLVNKKQVRREANNTSPASKRKKDKKSIR